MRHLIVLAVLLGLIGHRPTRLVSTLVQPIDHIIKDFAYGA